MENETMIYVAADPTQPGAAWAACVDANSKPLGDVATLTIDGLLDVIEDMVRQFAAERDDGQIDSSAMGALADAMHVLHTAERLQITYANGRRVIGKWASNV